MLGEISLQQWRCLAELIDNSVDAFIEAQRANAPITTPQIHITVPMTANSNSIVTVKDNGTGMSVPTLETAAKAGWSSHDPVNNLGLFGMGFNIATARLGLRTVVWTTRKGDAEWTGMEIDFAELNRQKHFRTPLRTRPKPNLVESGTEIEISKLKQDQLEWFARGANRNTIERQLGRTYSAMLQPSGVPIHFELQINGTKVEARPHCVWDAARSVQTTRWGEISAVQPIDVRLGARPYCTKCWNWMGIGETQCPSCGPEGNVISRDRRIHGWLGIQRFLDEKEFGIDILRNGRKIELGNKDLFQFVDENTGNESSDYPIDDPRNRGRIVGEMHLDHCSVPYTKERFVRDDVAWSEMVEVIRGRGPLRPEVAENLGFPANSSPLFKLFQAFRRSSPHNRTVGGWSKILVAEDNDAAKEMGKRFEKGEPDYQTDQKWWDLVEAADAAILSGNGSGGATSVRGRRNRGGATPPTTTPTGTGSTTTPSATRSEIGPLSRRYTDTATNQRLDVKAWRVAATDPELIQGAAWTMRKNPNGVHEFFVNPAHAVFRSQTLTVLDALLAQLALVILDFDKGIGGTATFAGVLASLRAEYAKVYRLDPITIEGDARMQITSIARSVVGKADAGLLEAFYNQLSATQREQIEVEMASKAVAKPRDAITDGRFLEHCPPRIVTDFVLANPQLFFDGKYWDDPYVDTGYISSAGIEEAQRRVRTHYANLLNDLIWLVEQGAPALKAVSRPRLLRASLANILLDKTSQE